MNTWYVVAKEDKKSIFGYKQITKKGEYFLSNEEAEIERIYLQPDYNEKLVVLRRTCEVL